MYLQCVCRHVEIDVCMFAFVCMFENIHTNMHAYMPAYMPAYIDTCVYMDKYINRLYVNT